MAGDGGAVARRPVRPVHRRSGRVTRGSGRVTRGSGPSLLPHHQAVLDRATAEYDVADTVAHPGRIGALVDRRAQVDDPARVDVEHLRHELRLAHLQRPPAAGGRRR